LLWFGMVSIAVFALGCEGGSGDSTGDESGVETTGDGTEGETTGADFPEEEFGKCYDPNENKNQPSCTVASDCGSNSPDSYWNCQQGCCLYHWFEDEDLYLCNTETGADVECQKASDCGADNESWYWSCEEGCCGWEHWERGPTGSRERGPTGSQNGSSFVSNNLPDSIECGEILDVVIEVKNEGTTTWTEEDKYRLGAVGDQNLFGDFVRVLLPDDTEVPPGETWAFSFQLSAPPASYVSYLTAWRMVHEHQGWFGPNISRVVDVTCAEK